MIQYNPASDSWERLGTLKDDRLAHEVVEVPGEMCGYFDLSSGGGLPTPTQEVTAVADTLEIPPSTDIGIR